MSGKKKIPRLDHKYRVLEEELKLNSPHLTISQSQWVEHKIVTCLQRQKGWSSSDIPDPENIYLKTHRGAYLLIDTYRRLTVL